MMIQVTDVDQSQVSYPILRPGYQVIPITAEAVCLRCLDHSFVIRGPSATLVLHLLEAMDGTRDIAQLAEHTQINQALIMQILRRLSQVKIVIERDELLETSNQEFSGISFLAQMYLSAQMDYTQALQTVSHCLSSQVMVILGSSDMASLLSTQLTHSGIKQVHILPADQVEYAQLEKLAPTFLLHIARINDYHSALQINQWALRMDTPWVSGWQAGLYLNMTHVMIPGENACFECILLRQQRNYMHFEADQAYEQFLRHEHTDLSFQASLPALDQLLVSFMCMQTMSFILGRHAYAPAPRLLEFSPIEMESMHHPVLRLPHCPTCGSINRQTQTYPYLNASFFDTSPTKESL